MASGATTIFLVPFSPLFFVAFCHLSFSSFFFFLYDKKKKFQFVDDILAQLEAEADIVDIQEQILVCILVQC